MGLWTELKRDFVRDFDYGRPQVTVSDTQVVLENVSAIVMLSETAITVRHGRAKTARFTTVTGRDFTVREIYEGRLLIGGTIQSLSFLQPPD